MQFSKNTLNDTHEKRAIDVTPFTLIPVHESIEAPSFR